MTVIFVTSFLLLSFCHVSVCFWRCSGLHCWLHFHFLVVLDRHIRFNTLRTNECSLQVVTWRQVTWPLSVCGVELTITQLMVVPLSSSFPWLGNKHYNGSSPLLTTRTIYFRGPFSDGIYWSGEFRLAPAVHFPVCCSLHFAAHSLRLEMYACSDSRSGCGNGSGSGGYIQYRRQALMQWCDNPCKSSIYISQLFSLLL